jgi:Tfp pilus assembly protein PilX
MKTMQRERGAVSIFIVIFTALLVTIVTTSFIQLMVHNQEQATNNDLSQRAYDSALAGVEDAKRALVALKSCDTTPAANCASLRAALVNNGTTDCQVLGSLGMNVNFTNGEVAVGDGTKNQAYTCVRVTVLTDSYKGTLNKNDSVVIPLHSEDDTDLSISGVRISWFLSSDIPNGVSKTPSYPASTLLPKDDNVQWPTNRPPIMRSQMIQFVRGNLKLSDFDAAGNNNAKSLFLFPMIAGGNQDFALDGRLAPGSRNGVAPSPCDTTYTKNGYACSVDVSIPALPAGTTARDAYLQLTSLYNNATYQVQLIGSGGTIINFNNVQPNVDSTGRASDLFRRVSARVSVTGGPGSTYPDAALYLGKSLCKDFFITNQSADYGPDASGNGICEPAN